MDLNKVCSVRDELKIKVEKLEDKLVQLTCDYERLCKENERMKLETLERKCWWKNAKEFAIVSWAVIQNAAYLMLPAL